MPGSKPVTVFPQNQIITFNKKHKNLVIYVKIKDVLHYASQWNLCWQQPQSWQKNDIHDAVLWIMMTCSLVRRYKRFGKICCLQFDVWLCLYQKPAIRLHSHNPQGHNLNLHHTGNPNYSKKYACSCTHNSLQP